MKTALLLAALVVIALCQEDNTCGPDGEGHCSNGCPCEGGPQHCPDHDLECSILNPDDCCCYDNSSNPPTGCNDTSTDGFF